MDEIKNSKETSVSKYKFLEFQRSGLVHGFNNPRMLRYFTDLPRAVIKLKKDFKNINKSDIETIMDV